MIDFSLNVASLFDGENILSNRTIHVKDGRIEQITKNISGKDALLGMLVPGYIDVQVNGGGGFLFNQTPTPQTIEKIGKAHQKFGTTGWLPTLVTDSIEQMQKAADAVAASIKNEIPGVLGIHFEGPFLSVEKKGVHSEALIRAISEAEIEILIRKDLGKVVVTLAPEHVSPEQIAMLVREGIIVCLGHSNATFEQTKLALEAGATGFTHLFNAMSSLSSREPGVVGAALLDENSYAGLILDGIHVHADTARLAFKLKEKLMLVTDAMPTVGTDETQFEFFGDIIQRRGLTLTDSQGRLAGSALDMNSAVKNAVEMFAIEKIEAINLASANPAKFLGLSDDYGNLKLGAKASMILLDKDGNISNLWIDGKN